MDSRMELSVVPVGSLVQNLEVHSRENFPQADMIWHQTLCQTRRKQWTSMDQRDDTDCIALLLCRSKNERWNSSYPIENNQLLLKKWFS